MFRFPDEMCNMVYSCGFWGLLTDEMDKWEIFHIFAKMRITKRRWLILTILVLTSVIVVMAYLFNRKRLCVPSQDLTEIVETGDLVFSAGESIRSDIVRFMNADSECEYSHIGLVIKGESEYKIVHMSSEL